MVSVDQDRSLSSLRTHLADARKPDRRVRLRLVALTDIDIDALGALVIVASGAVADPSILEVGNERIASAGQWRNAIGVARNGARAAASVWLAATIVRGEAEANLRLCVD